MEVYPTVVLAEWVLQLGDNVSVSWPVVLWVLPLVFTSLAIGFYLGCCVTRQRDDQRLNRQRQTILAALTKLVASTNQLSHDVDSHSTELQKVEYSISGLNHVQDLEQAQQELIGQIERALTSNRRLEHDLVCARHLMDVQAVELDRTRQEARTDPLSGVLNRKGFDEYLEYALARFEAHSHPFALLLCDVDHFKRINDTHGHLAGDEVVGRLGQALQRSIRPGHDCVARYGGDEFAVLLMGVNREDAVAAAERIRRDIERHNFDVGRDGSRLAVTFSLGLTTPLSGDNPAGLLQRADQALYRAKRLGRNQLQVYPENHESTATVPTLVDC